MLFETMLMFIRGAAGPFAGRRVSIVAAYARPSP
jgi:hypothetical protein